MEDGDFFELQFDDFDGFAAAVYDVDVDKDAVAAYPGLSMDAGCYFDFAAVGEVEVVGGKEGGGEV